MKERSESTEHHAIGDNFQLVHREKSQRIYALFSLARNLDDRGLLFVRLSIVLFVF